MPSTSLETRSRRSCYLDGPVVVCIPRICVDERGRFYVCRTQSGPVTVPDHS